MSQNNFVLDCNIWFSIFHKQKAELLLDTLLNSDVELFANAELLKELLHMMHHPNTQGLIPRPFKKHIDFVKAITTDYPTDKRFALLRDYKDNYLVDLCVQSNAALVTNDKGFTMLKKLKHPKVSLIGKAEFYKILGW